MLARQLFFPFLIFITIVQGLGQDVYKVDSLVTRLNDQLRDSTRCRILFEIAYELKEQDTTRAIKYLESGREIALSIDHTKGMGRYFEVMGALHRHHGFYPLAIMDYDRALAYYSEADDDVAYFRALKDKGTVYLFRSEFRQAMNHYRSALDFYKRNDMADGIQRCLNNIGIIHKNRGDYVEALTTLDESVQYLDPETQHMDIAQAYINMGNVFVHLGSYERALEYFELAREIAERENSLKDIALCLANAGVVSNKCNKYDEALNLYKRSLEICETTNDVQQLSNCLINIGTNYADMGQPEVGIDYVNRGLKIKKELGDEKAISNCYIHLAEINMMMEEYNRSIELFTQAIPVKERLEDKEGLIRCYLGMGSVYLAREQYKSAGDMTELSLTISKEIRALEHIVRGLDINRQLAEAEGDYTSAYHYAMRHNQYNDSLMDDASDKAVMEMEFRYRSKVLEKENENLRIQSNLTEELMQKRNAFLYSLVGIALLLAIGLLLGAWFLRRLRLTSMKLEEKNIVITRQNLKLDHLNRTKDRMMSIIAHDLRGTIGNQLTAIDVLHRIEGMEDPGIDKNKLLGNLKLSSSYSLELLENLLHWSRLEENESYFHAEEVNLNTLIDSCLALFDETAKNKGLLFSMKINGPIKCHVDRIMMETMLRNLISNAIKFSNRGGTITLSAELEDDSVHFAITDQGIGLTQEQIVKITSNGGFTRRGTDNEKGAGIGLTLVREFTSIHNGQLHITSEPGKGSCFEIVFPCGK
ncbi:MAG: tetratricopeptide repeat protein [Bacteroidales bacterium]|nr:tetratricopeptide repeat protein [Bacteroidales bacterium]